MFLQFIGYKMFESVCLFLFLLATISNIQLQSDNVSVVKCRPWICEVIHFVRRQHAKDIFARFEVPTCETVKKSKETGPKSIKAIACSLTKTFTIHYKRVVDILPQSIILQGFACKYKHRKFKTNFHQKYHDYKNITSNLKLYVRIIDLEL